MSFLLDTDICSAYMKGNGQVHSRFIQYGGRLHISVATLAELYTCTLRAKASPRRAQGLFDLLIAATALTHNFSLVTHNVQEIQ